MSAIAKRAEVKARTAVAASSAPPPPPPPAAGVATQEQQQQQQQQQQAPNSAQPTMFAASEADIDADVL